MDQSATPEPIVHNITIDMHDPTVAKEFYTHKITETGFLHVQISNVPIKAKLDSGADLDIISEKTFHQLPLFLKHRIKRRLSHVRTANTSHPPTVTIGTIRLPVTVYQQKFNVTFSIMIDASYGMFLGKNFLKTHRAKIDHEADTITLSLSIVVKR